ncbi:unnamed protein product [Caenorhabditis nigoni]
MYKEIPPYPLSRLISRHKEVVKCLTAEFVRDGDYEITEKWVNFIYSKNKLNEVKAREELCIDEKVRLIVQQLHNYTNQNGADIDCAFKLINILVCCRNHFLGTLHRVPTDQLIFDFHWFTVPQALLYLEDIRDELESDPRVASEEIRVELIVGRGDYPDSIRRAFLQKHNVSGVENALFLTIPKTVKKRVPIRKTPVYSDFLDWSALL